MKHSKIIDAIDDGVKSGNLITLIAFVKNLTWEIQVKYNIRHKNKKAHTAHNMNLSLGLREAKESLDLIRNNKTNPGKTWLNWLKTEKPEIYKRLRSAEATYNGSRVTIV